jgi:dipeptidyl aminopeptidase/acylaminoacyl peptidase
VISDIEDCSKFIRSSWAKGGKTPKIGIFGWSYGGYSTFFAMTRFAGAYDAGVAMVGMSNLYTFLMNTAPYRRILRISEYGDPEKDKEALKKLSPITYLDQVRSPLLITQGVNDPRVPAGEAIQIQEALTRKKIPSQLILFGDEGHGATKRENRVLELGNLIQFFNKHLQ